MYSLFRRQKCQCVRKRLRLAHKFSHLIRGVKLVVEHEGQGDGRMPPRLVLEVERAIELTVVVDETEGGRLTPTGREGLGLAMEKDAPQKGANSVAHHQIQHLTRVLCFHNGHLDVTRMVDCILEGRFGNFVKDDSWRGFDWERQHLTNVPRNGFSFAIVVGGQDDVLKGFGNFAHVCDICLLFFHQCERGFKSMIDALETVGDFAKMAARGNALVIGAEIGLDLGAF